MDVVIDIGVAVEHEQAAEPAHQLARLLILAQRLNRTDRQSGAVCRVEATLQEQVEIESFAAKLQAGEDIETVVGEILIPFRRLRFLSYIFLCSKIASNT